MFGIFLTFNTIYGGLVVKTLTLFTFSKNHIIINVHVFSFLIVPVAWALVVKPKLAKLHMRKA